MSHDFNRLEVLVKKRDGQGLKMADGSYTSVLKNRIQDTHALSLMAVAESRVSQDHNRVKKCGRNELELTDELAAIHWETFFVFSSIQVIRSAVWETR